MRKSIYSLQSRIRRLSKTRKSKKDNFNKIKELEQEIYNLAVKENKLYVATQYAKKLEPTTKKAIEKVQKSFGKVLRKDEKYISKAKVDLSSKLKTDLLNTFTKATATRLYNTPSIRKNIIGKEKEEIKQYAVDYFKDLIIGDSNNPNSKAIFKYNSEVTGVKEKLDELFKIAREDVNIYQNLADLLDYTYDKVIYFKYHFNEYDEAIDKGKHAEDPEFFTEVAEEMLYRYKKMLR